jgi:excisionase family DNA binding protein
MNVPPINNPTNSNVKSGTGHDQSLTGQAQGLRSLAGGPVTVGRAAALIGVSATTVIRYMETGKLDGITLPSGHRRISQASLDAFMQAAR